MTLLYSDPLFLKHDTGRHPECADRLRTIHARLEKAGLVKKCQPGTYKALTEEEVRQVHAAEQIQRVRQACTKGGGHIEADTVVSADSFQVGLAAAGACVSAVDAVVKGPERRALCLVRPPGHHATPTHSMGFCLFNNIALAARHARVTHGLTRILIVDFDVHHGNGTQDTFYEDPEITFFSIHRFGNGFYPGTGAKDETGRGRGLGHTLNAPIRYGTSRADYHSQFTKALEKVAALSRPELVLLSAGFDAHKLDPVGSLGLEVEDFTTLTRQVLDVARTHAHGQIVSCLEGGYHLDALAESVQAHLEELLASEKR